MSNPTVFKTNPNKDFLRSVYDKEIIQSWRTNLGRRLQYIGLPGPEMLDIIEWQDLLDKFTTIERSENEQHLLFLRANVRDIEHRLHSLYGEFDKILAKGRDKYKRSPNWPYDIVNLDYFGGFLYQDMARPKALRKLIENQDEYQRSFLLIITQDVRDGDTNEKLSFLEGLRQQLERDYGLHQTTSNFINWHKRVDTPDATRQSLYMNCFLRDHGEIAHFRVNCRPVIIYTGTGGTRMLHFVTEFFHQKSEHRAVSEQSLHDVLNLGILELREGCLTTSINIPKLPPSKEGW